MMHNRRNRWLAVLTAGTALASAACGSGSGAGSGVASLSAGDTEQVAGESVLDRSTAGDKDPEEAMLDFARCMREHGVDMPDPEFTGGGGGAGAVRATAAIRIGGEVDADALEAADEACRPLLADAGPLREMTPEERQEMQDKAIEHARCMREHGIDMPDPTFDTSGGGAMIRVPSGARGAIDFDSDEFAEAAEACGELLGGANGGRSGVSFSAGRTAGSSK